MSDSKLSKRADEPEGRASQQNEHSLDSLPASKRHQLFTDQTKEMAQKTVEKYLEEQGYSTSSIPEDRQWMLKFKLGDFEGFGKFRSGRFEEFEDALKTSLGIHDSTKSEVSDRSSGQKLDSPRSLDRVSKQFDSRLIPKTIDGKKVNDVPCEGNNCSFYALLRNPRVRRRLAKMAEARRRNVDDLEKEIVEGAREAAGGGNKMLGFDSKKVGEAVEYLRKMGVLEPDCGIRVHFRHHLSGKIESFDATLGNNEDIENLPKYTKPPYEVFFANKHYWMVESSSKQQGKPVHVNEMIENSPVKQRLTELFMNPASIIEEKDNGLSIVQFREIIDRKEEYLREMGVSLNIYKDLKYKYSDMVQEGKFKIGENERSRELLKDFVYRLTKARLIDLVRKLEPTKYKGIYEVAFDRYCEVVKPGQKHLQEIVDLLEENKDEACEWLFDNGDNIEGFIKRLDQQKPMKQMQTKQKIMSPYVDGKTLLDSEIENLPPTVTGY